MYIEMYIQLKLKCPEIVNVVPSKMFVSECDKYSNFECLRPRQNVHRKKDILIVQTLFSEIFTIA